MKTTKTNDYISLLLVASIVIFSFFDLCWIFQSRNNVYSEDIAATLWLVDITYDKYLETGTIDFKPIFESNESQLMLLFYLFIYLLFGVNIKILYLINLALLLSALLLFYYAIKSIYDRKTASLFQIILLSLPGTVFITRFLQEQIFQLFSFSLCFYFLVKSRNFSDRNNSLAFGISLGLFALIRHSSLPYVTMLIIYIVSINFTELKKYIFDKKIIEQCIFFYVVMIIAIWDYIRLQNGTVGFLELLLSSLLIYSIINYYKKTLIDKASNLSAALSVFLWITLPIYLMKFTKLVLRYAEAASLERTYNMDFIRYTELLIMTHTNLIVFISLIICIVYFLIRKETYKFDKFFILMLAIPYIILSLFPIKSDQAIYLLLIPVSLIIASVSKNSRVIMLFFMFSMIYYSSPFKEPFNIGISFGNAKIPILSKTYNRYYIVDYGTDSKFSIVKKDHLPTIYSIIKENTNQSNVSLLILTSLSALESDRILFITLANKLNNPKMISKDFTDFKKSENVTELMYHFDFIVSEQSFSCMVDEIKFIKHKVNALRIFNETGTERFKKEFSLVEIYPYANNCTLNIFRSNELISP